MAALVDSGFMIALLSDEDERHVPCVNVFTREREMLLPIVSLPEIAYIMVTRRRRSAFVDFLQSLEGIQLVTPTTADLARAAEIMRQYADANIDFVDSAIMAMAERLNITRILTVDQRDFRIFRPKHIPHFTILP